MLAIISFNWRTASPAASNIYCDCCWDHYCTSKLFQSSLPSH